MENLFPSEIARLVLGYLKEEGCTEAYQSFLRESRHLQEYATLLEKGLEYSTRVNGLNLPETLDEFADLKKALKRGTKHTRHIVSKSGEIQRMVTEDPPVFNETVGGSSFIINDEMPGRYARSEIPNPCSVVSGMSKTTKRGRRRKSNVTVTKRTSILQDACKAAALIPEEDNEHRLSSDKAAALVVPEENKEYRLSSDNDISDAESSLTDIFVPRKKSSQGKAKKVTPPGGEDEEGCVDCSKNQKTGRQTRRSARLKKSKSPSKKGNSDNLLTSPAKNTRSRKRKSSAVSCREPPETDVCDNSDRAVTMAVDDCFDPGDNGYQDQVDDGILPTPPRVTEFDRSQGLPSPQPSTSVTNPVLITEPTATIVVLGTPVKLSQPLTLVIPEEQEELPSELHTPKNVDVQSMMSTPSKFNDTASMISVGRSPKRKSHMPRRRVNKPPATRLPFEAEESLNFNFVFDDPVSMDMSHVVGKLLENTQLQEKLAENITKAVTSVQPPTQSHTSAEQSKPEEPKPQESLDSLLAKQDCMLNEETIGGILEMTKGDPTFDALFDLFNVDKDHFSGTECKKPVPSSDNSVVASKDVNDNLKGASSVEKIKDIDGSNTLLDRLDAMVSAVETQPSSESSKVTNPVDGQIEQEQSEVVHVFMIQNAEGPVTTKVSSFVQYSVQDQPGPVNDGKNGAVSPVKKRLDENAHTATQSSKDNLGANKSMVHDLSDESIRPFSKELMDLKSPYLSHTNSPAPMDMQVLSPAVKDDGKSDLDVVENAHDGAVLLVAEVSDSADVEMPCEENETSPPRSPDQDGAQGDQYPDMPVFVSPSDDVRSPGSNSLENDSQKLDDKELDEHLNEEDVHVDENCRSECSENVEVEELGDARSPQLESDEASVPSQDEVQPSETSNESATPVKVPGSGTDTEVIPDKVSPQKQEITESRESGIQWKLEVLEMGPAPENVECDEFASMSFEKESSKTKVSGSPQVKDASFTKPCDTSGVKPRRVPLTTISSTPSPRTPAFDEQYTFADSPLPSPFLRNPFSPMVPHTPATVSPSQQMFQKPAVDHVQSTSFSSVESTASPCVMQGKSRDPRLARSPRTVPQIPKRPLEGIVKQPSEGNASEMEISYEAPPSPFLSSIKMPCTPTLPHIDVESPRTVSQSPSKCSKGAVATAQEETLSVVTDNVELAQSEVVDKAPKNLPLTQVLEKSPEKGPATPKSEVFSPKPDNAFTMSDITPTKPLSTSSPATKVKHKTKKTRKKDDTDSSLGISPKLKVKSKGKKGISKGKKPVLKVSIGKLKKSKKANVTEPKEKKKASATSTVCSPAEGYVTADEEMPPAKCSPARIESPSPARIESPSPVTKKPETPKERSPCVESFPCSSPAEKLPYENYVTPKRKGKTKRKTPKSSHKKEKPEKVAEEEEVVEKTSAPITDGTAAESETRTDRPTPKSRHKKEEPKKVVEEVVEITIEPITDGTAAESEKRADSATPKLSQKKEKPGKVAGEEEVVEKTSAPITDGTAAESEKRADRPTPKSRHKKEKPKKVAEEVVEKTSAPITHGTAAESETRTDRATPKSRHKKEKPEKVAKEVVETTSALITDGTAAESETRTDRPTSKSSHKKDKPEIIAEQVVDKTSAPITDGTAAESETRTDRPIPKSRHKKEKPEKVSEDVVEITSAPIADGTAADSETRTDRPIPKSKHKKEKAKKVAEEEEVEITSAPIADGTAAESETRTDRPIPKSKHKKEKPEKVAEEEEVEITSAPIADGTAAESETRTDRPTPKSRHKKQKPKKVAEEEVVEKTSAPITDGTAAAESETKTDRPTPSKRSNKSGACKSKKRARRELIHSLDKEASASTPREKLESNRNVESKHEDGEGHFCGTAVKSNVGIPRKKSKTKTRREVVHSGVKTPSKEVVDSRAQLLKRNKKPEVREQDATEQVTSEEPEVGPQEVASSCEDSGTQYLDTPSKVRSINEFTTPGKGPIRIQLLTPDKDSRMSLHSTPGRSSVASGYTPGKGSAICSPSTSAYSPYAELRAAPVQTTDDDYPEHQDLAIASIMMTPRKGFRSPKYANEEQSSNESDDTVVSVATVVKEEQRLAVDAILQPSPAKSTCATPRKTFLISHGTPQKSSSPGSSNEGRPFSRVSEDAEVVFKSPNTAAELRRLKDRRSPVKALPTKSPSKSRQEFDQDHRKRTEEESCSAEVDYREEQQTAQKSDAECGSQEGQLNVSATTPSSSNGLPSDIDTPISDQQHRVMMESLSSESLSAFTAFAQSIANEEKTTTTLSNSVTTNATSREASADLNHLVSTVPQPSDLAGDTSSFHMMPENEPSLATSTPQQAPRDSSSAVVVDSSFIQEEQEREKALLEEMNNTLASMANLSSQGVAEKQVDEAALAEEGLAGFSAAQEQLSITPQNESSHGMANFADSSQVLNSSGHFPQQELPQLNTSCIQNDSINSATTCSDMWTTPNSSYTVPIPKSVNLQDPGIQVMHAKTNKGKQIPIFHTPHSNADSQLNNIEPCPQMMQKSTQLRRVPVQVEFINSPQARALLDDSQSLETAFRDVEECPSLSNIVHRQTATPGSSKQLQSPNQLSEKPASSQTSSNAVTPLSSQPSSLNSSPDKSSVAGSMSSGSQNPEPADLGQRSGQVKRKKKQNGQSKSKKRRVETAPIDDCDNAELLDFLQAPPVGDLCKKHNLRNSPRKSASNSPLKGVKNIENYKFCSPAPSGDATQDSNTNMWNDIVNIHLDDQTKIMADITRPLSELAQKTPVKGPVSHAQGTPGKIPTQITPAKFATDSNSSSKFSPAQRKLTGTPILKSCSIVENRVVPSPSSQDAEDFLPDADVNLEEFLQKPPSTKPAARKARRRTNSKVQLPDVSVTPASKVISGSETVDNLCTSPIEIAAAQSGILSQQNVPAVPSAQTFLGNQAPALPISHIRLTVPIQAAGQPLQQPQAVGQPHQPQAAGLPLRPQAAGQPFQPQAVGQPLQPQAAGQPFHPQAVGQPLQPQAAGQPLQPQAAGQPDGLVLVPLGNGKFAVVPSSALTILSTTPTVPKPAPTPASNPDPYGIGELTKKRRHERKPNRKEKKPKERKHKEPKARRRKAKKESIVADLNRTAPLVEPNSPGFQPGSMMPVDQPPLQMPHPVPSQTAVMEPNPQAVQPNIMISVNQPALQMPPPVMNQSVLMEPNQAVQPNIMMSVNQPQIQMPPPALSNAQMTGVNNMVQGPSTIPPLATPGPMNVPATGGVIQTPQEFSPVKKEPKKISPGLQALIRLASPEAKAKATIGSDLQQSINGPPPSVQPKPKNLAKSVSKNSLTSLVSAALEYHNPAENDDNERDVLMDIQMDMPTGEDFLTGNIAPRNRLQTYNEIDIQTPQSDKFEMNTSAVPAGVKKSSSRKPSASRGKQLDKIKANSEAKAKNSHQSKSKKRGANNIVTSPPGLPPESLVTDMQGESEVVLSIPEGATSTIDTDLLSSLLDDGAGNALLGNEEPSDTTVKGKASRTGSKNSTTLRANAVMDGSPSESRSLSESHSEHLAAKQNVSEKKGPNSKSTIKSKGPVPSVTLQKKAPSRTKPKQTKTSQTCEKSANRFYFTSQNEKPKEKLPWDAALRATTHVRALQFDSEVETDSGKVSECDVQKKLHAKDGSSHSVGAKHDSSKKSADQAVPKKDLGRKRKETAKARRGGSNEKSDNPSKTSPNVNERQAVKGMQVEDDKEAAGPSSVKLPRISDGFGSAKKTDRGHKKKRQRTSSVPEIEAEKPVEDMEIQVEVDDNSANTEEDCHHVSQDEVGSDAKDSFSKESDEIIEKRKFDVRKKFEESIKTDHSVAENPKSKKVRFLQTRKNERKNATEHKLDPKSLKQMKVKSKGKDFVKLDAKMFAAICKAAGYESMLQQVGSGNSDSDKDDEPLDSGSGVAEADTANSSDDEQLQTPALDVQSRTKVAKTDLKNKKALKLTPGHEKSDNVERVVKLKKRSPKLTVQVRPTCSVEPKTREETKSGKSPGKSSTSTSPRGSNLESRQRTHEDSPRTKDFVLKLNDIFEDVVGHHSLGAANTKLTPKPLKKSRKASGETNVRESKSPAKAKKPHSEGSTAGSCSSSTKASQKQVTKSSSGSASSKSKSKTKTESEVKSKKSEGGGSKKAATKSAQAQTKVKKSAQKAKTRESPLKSSKVHEQKPSSSEKGRSDVQSTKSKTRPSPNYQLQMDYKDIFGSSSSLSSSDDDVALSELQHRNKSSPESTKTVAPKKEAKKAPMKVCVPSKEANLTESKMLQLPSCSHAENVTNEDTESDIEVHAAEALVSMAMTRTPRKASEEEHRIYSDSVPPKMFATPEKYSGEDTESDFSDFILPDLKTTSYVDTACNPPPLENIVRTEPRDSSEHSVNSETTQKETALLKTPVKNVSMDVKRRTPRKGTPHKMVMVNQDPLGDLKKSDRNFYSKPKKQAKRLSQRKNRGKKKPYDM